MKVNQNLVVKYLKEHTLIAPRRMHADPKAICAGGKPQVSFATPSTWITPPNVERAISRPFFRWDFENIDARGRCEGGVRNKAARENPNHI